MEHLQLHIFNLHTKKIDFQHKIKLCTSVKLIILHITMSFLQWFWVLLMMGAYKTRKLLLQVTCRRHINNFQEQYYFRPSRKRSRKEMASEVVRGSKFCLTSLDEGLRWLVHLYLISLKYLRQPSPWSNFVEHWFVKTVSLQARSKMSKWPCMIVQNPYWIMIKCANIPLSLSFPWSFNHSGLNFLWYKL